jgi:hypothetical protein
VDNRGYISPSILEIALYISRYFIMPSRIRESSSSASSSVNDGGWPGNNVIVSDDEYPAVYFDGQAERPLSEQLTPIAVVGMGLYSLFNGLKHVILTF